MSALPTTKLSTKPARRLIVISGERTWCQQTAEQLIAPLAHQFIIKLNEEVDHNKQALRLLGVDAHAVVIDAFTGLDPNAFAAVSGTIVAGGALILLCPTLSQWADYADPFNAKLTPFPLHTEDVTGHYLARWVSLLKSNEVVELLSQGVQSNCAPITPYQGEHEDDNAALTTDQTSAVSAVVKVMTGQRKRPAVLVADRGRGKSAVLGLGIASLLQQNLVKHVAVIGGQAQSTDTVFKHLNAGLGLSADDSQAICFGAARVEKISVDEALSNGQAYDLMLVDEAASIGLPRLEKLLKSHSRLVFATTVQGYEGSGRGFHLKFRQTLDQCTRGARFCQLQQAIRWAEDDPLEHITDRLLLLRAKTSAAEVPSIETLVAKELTSEELVSDELVSDESLMEQIMGLLVSAHYQTRPVDLRYLLDAPNHRLFVQFHQETVSGVLWLCEEGGLEEEMAQAVCLGQRRPKGHLVPEILAAHLGLAGGARCLTARVQRIAIRPDFQNRGFGSTLLTDVESLLDGEVDLFASSFGADISLLNFWKKSAYHVVRMSDSVNSASGLYSALVLKAVSLQGKAVKSEARISFKRQFEAQLTESLRELDWPLLRELSLTMQSPIEGKSLSAQCLSDLMYFTQGHRPYESTVGSLQKLGRLVVASPAAFSQLDETYQRVLVRKLLQQKSWATIASELQQTGRKEVEATLRQAVKASLAQL